MAFGLSWWSTIPVVPHEQRLDGAEAGADARSMSRSRAVSSRHQICSRISPKFVGTCGGAGMPRASVEYR